MREDLRYRLSYPEESPSPSTLCNDLASYRDIKASEASGRLTSDKQLDLLRAINYWYHQWDGPCGRLLLESWRLKALRVGDAAALNAALSLRKELSASPPFYPKGFLLGKPEMVDADVEKNIPRCPDPAAAYGILLKHVLSEHKRYCARYQVAPEEDAEEGPPVVSALDAEIDRMQELEYKQVLRSLRCS